MDVLIIEDEETAARRLKKLIGEIAPEMNVVGILDSIEGTLNWLEQNELPTLVFLDIHLADGSSFEIFNYKQIETPIIFTTAYDEYALKAFKLNAVDYLLKPIKRAELKQAIEKFGKLQGQQPVIDYQKLAESLQQKQAQRRFLIRVGQIFRVVEIKDVAYFYTESKITFLVTHEGKRYPVDFSLEKLEEELDRRSFFRINRQFIIGLQAIKEMYAYSKSRVKIELNPACELDSIVSTERSPYFKKWLSGEL